ncbi:MAG: hypothetical protein K9K38_16565 [Rhodoferax sp.]|nr:hypothetical protein [Rhodoferax sp.]MCF8210992.1 hypothetical protein [Rhodoferax sp.]
MNTQTLPGTTLDPSGSGRYRWLPTIEVVPGMVIARPVVGLSGVRETMYIAIGSTITTNMAAQLVVKGVECVAVFDTSNRDAGADDYAIAAFETRLQSIFGPSPDIHCTALMNALRLAGHTIC